MSRLIFLVLLCVAFAYATLSKSEVQELAQKLKAEPRALTTIGEREYFIGSEVTLMWWDALEVCNALGNGKTLASLETEEETDAIKNHLQTNVLPTDYWISLKEIEPTVWIWVGSGQIATYFDWPRNVAVQEMTNCVQMAPGGWIVDVCNAQKHFICEGPKKTEPIKKKLTGLF